MRPIGTPVIGGTVIVPPLASTIQFAFPLRAMNDAAAPAGRLKGIFGPPPWIEEPGDG